MKRVLLSVVTVGALVFGGLMTTSAKADGFHHRQCYVPPVRNFCGPPSGCNPIGYGWSGFSGGWNTSYYGGWGGNCGPRYVPYGAGYIGGYQPYQQLNYRGPRYGFSLGF